MDILKIIYKSKFKNNSHLYFESAVHSHDSKFNIQKGRSVTVTRPHCPGCPVPSPPVFSQRHSVYKPPPSHAFPLIVLLQCITSCSTPGFLPLKIFLVIVLCQLESSSSSLLYGCMLVISLHEGTTNYFFKLFFNCCSSAVVTNSLF